jgi:hypothetical protein
MGQTGRPSRKFSGTTTMLRVGLLLCVFSPGKWEGWFPNEFHSEVIRPVIFRKNQGRRAETESLVRYTPVITQHVGEPKVESNIPTFSGKVQVAKITSFSWTQPCL